jgi:hypothetical protein
MDTDKLLGISFTAVHWWHRQQDGGPPVVSQWPATDGPTLMVHRWTASGQPLWLSKFGNIVILLLLLHNEESHRNSVNTHTCIKWYWSQDSRCGLCWLHYWYFIYLYIKSVILESFTKTYGLVEDFRTIDPYLRYLVAIWPGVKTLKSWRQLWVSLCWFIGQEPTLIQK